MDDVARNVEWMAACQPDRTPPITEHQHPINTSIITQTLRIGAEQRPGLGAESFAASRLAFVLSGRRVCRAVSQQAYLLSLCCLFDRVFVSDV